MKKNKAVKSILISGASGMLGTKLTGFLSKKHRVIALVYKNPDLLKGFRNTEIIEGNITSKKFVENIKKNYQVMDAIIHCAAMTKVDECELNKKRCFSTNVAGTKKIVNLAKHYRANLIYISTPMVFSGAEGNYEEKDKPKPQNYYAKTKLLGEREVLKYKKSLVLRINPIGVRPPGAHPSFIQWFFEMAGNNRSFTLFSDVRINPISIDTLVKIIAKLLVNHETGILHLGSRDVINKADIWDFILSKFPKFSGKVNKDSVDNTRAGKTAKRPKEMWLNVQKAVSLGYKMPGWRKEVEIVLKELGL